MTCLLCFDEMDMLPYKDPNNSTSTCVKLSCDHAFHTKCIITCLEKSDHKCPLCCTRKSPKDELTREGIIRNVIRELKRNAEIKRLIEERKTAREEILSTLKTIKKDTEKFAAKRAEELKFFEKREYYKKCTREAFYTATKVATEKNPLFTGVLFNKSRPRHTRSYDLTLAHRLFFGSENTRCEWRITTPRIYACIKKTTSV